MSDAEGAAPATHHEDPAPRIQPRPGTKALYAAFDVFPSAKGAATHIHHMAEALFAQFGGGLLYVLADERTPIHQREAGFEVLRYLATEENLLLRAQGFSARLALLVDDLGDELRLAHFRDPWSGLPILDRAPPGCRTVYEVNGLPSIELPHRYPHLSAQTIAALKEVEEQCLALSDVILTPAHTIKSQLVRRGVVPERVTVIPNGADAPPLATRPDDAPPRYALYFGALQPWQGVDTALRALALDPDPSLHLVICASVRPREARPLARLAERLGVTERVSWHHRLDKQTLAGFVRHAAVVVAPLTDCPRNVEQGCCPLKVLEAMAAGVPVVASDLPSVREVSQDGSLVWLVRPERPAELARAVRAVLDDETAAARAAAAQRHVLEHLTWRHTRAALAAVYERLCPPDD
jgi:glycosyltransferase involved in cell wall biosynthesis